MADTASFGWAVIGPGRIAHQFAEVVQTLPGMHLRAVFARDAGKATVFAQHWSRADRPVPRAVGNLDSLLYDPQVDAVYIATPHSHHGGFVRSALQAGKAVLCEKPLVPAQAEARALTDLAQARGVFLMEALWTRFLPAYDTVRAWLHEGAIGELRGLQSSFCFAGPYDPASRMYDPALAGGALLDIGIYNLAVTRLVLETVHGACPEPLRWDVQARLAPTGVDQRLAATLHFQGDVASQFICAFDTVADNSLHILGSRGAIVVPRPFWGASQARLLRQDQPPHIVDAPHAVNGFEGEVLETVRCVRTGLLQSPAMPHAETLALLGWMDALRSRIGVRYPFEPPATN